MNFKDKYKMTGLSANWCCMAWQVYTKDLSTDNDDYVEVVVLEEEEYTNDNGDNRIVLLLVEYHGDDLNIQTYDVYTTYSTDDMNKHLEENEYFYNDDVWYNRDTKTQMMNPVENINWVF